MKFSFACALLGVVFLVFALPGDRTLGKEPAAGAPATDDPQHAEWDAICATIEQYAAAYNAGNADAIGELYAENAELTDAAGTTFQGRKNIAAEYRALFQAHPKANIQMVVEKLTLVSPGVANEVGRTESRLDPEGPASPSRYVAVHVKEGDRWTMASVRDESLPTASRDKLDELKWLIGQWIDEGPDALMEIDCYWHESGSYLLRDFRIKIKGLLASSGTERIGWDPLRKQIRSWLFDADGGHLEASWIKEGDHWVVTAQGFRADGQPIHATYVVTSLREDAYHMAATQRTAGDEHLDDFEMTIVRRPPQPGASAEAPATPDAKPEPKKE